MNSEQHEREHLDRVFLYALQALPPDEVVAVAAHLSDCESCRREYENIKLIVRSFAAWPTDVLRPANPLWEQLSHRISDDARPVVVMTPSQSTIRPDWEEVGPGISVKILATDSENDRVTMLVRLAPGADYPPHRHAGVEELYLLHGQLMVDEKRIDAGGYCRALGGTVDHRVWSETGCTCVLLTSTKDALF